MTCKLGDFEGTWDVIVGAGTSPLRIAKDPADPEAYQLWAGKQPNAQSILHTGLKLDARCRTLKNDQICLSLWQSCNDLFAIEMDGSSESVNVWGARKAGGGSTEAFPDAGTPTWQEDWLVMKTQPEVGDIPPVDPDDTVKIKEQMGGECPDGTYKIFRNQDAQAFDTLCANLTNRSLDGQHLEGHRSIALWDRKTPAGPGNEPSNFIFAMVVVPETLMAEIRRVLPDVGEVKGQDILKVKAILKKASRYLPFEIEMLAKILAEGGEAGAWGAEEGGG